MKEERNLNTRCGDTIDRVRNRIFLLTFFFFFSTVLLSQGYLVHHYTEMDGLPTANVYGITQDHFGRMWFATRGGITVYDGASWKTYTVSDGLPVLPYYDIKTDQKGRIWALSDVLFGGPVMVYHDIHEDNNLPPWQRIPVHLPPIDQSKSVEITSFQLLEPESQDNKDLPAAVVGTAEQGLLVWFRGKWGHLNKYNGLLSNTVNGLAVLKGKLYVVSDKGLSIVTIQPGSQPHFNIDIDNRTNQSLDLPPGEIKGIGIQQEDKFPDTRLTDSRVWLYNNHWLAYFHENNLSMTLFPVDIPLAAETRQVIHLSPDYRSGVYVGSRHSINYFNYNTRSWESFRMNRGLISDGANSIFVDFEKNIWISCDRGINKIASRRFGNLQMRQGLLEDEVSALLEFEPGKFVLGHNNGITIYDGRQLRKVTLPQKVKAKQLPYRILDMQLDSKGNVWLAIGWGGLAKINPRTIDSPDQFTFEKHTSGLPENVICLWIDKHTDRLYAGTDRGIFFREITDTGKKQYREFVLKNIEKTSPFYTRRIFGNSGKLRYIACQNEGLYVYVENHQGNHWKNFYIPGDHNVNNVYAVKRDSSGRLLIGTLAGLFVLENDTLEKFKHNGFQVDRPVYFLLEDRKRRLWIGTNNGVIRWDGHTRRIYTTTEGLSGLETNRAAALEDSSGRIWIGTNNGVSIYQEEFDDHEAFQPQPKVQLLTLEAPGKQIPLTGNPIRLAYKKNTIGFHFRGLSFLDEEAVRYRHRLERFENEWSGEQYQADRMIRYTNLPPGTYRFYLKAKNTLGIWSDVVTSPPISILNPFYKTWWFYLLMVLTVGILFYAVIRFLLERHHAVLLEKEVKVRTDQLQAVEQRYRRLFEESKDVVFITTPEGKIIDFNPAGFHLLGFRSREEMLALESIADYFLNPEDRTRYREEIEKNGYVKDYEITYKRKDGQLVTTLETAAVERDQSGNIIAYWGIARDITDKKRLEEQLIQARKMEAIGTLAGGIAHDFNNILAVIMGQAELVSDELQEKVNKIEGPQLDWIRKSVRYIVTAADRGAELVKQILTFSRQSRQERKPIKIITIIKDSLSLLRSILPATVEIRRNIQDSSHLVLADSTQIRQVMLNFGTNAAHAMRETGGILTVTLEEVYIDAETVKQYEDIDTGFYLKLTVSDTGHGMPPEVMKRIFEPYFTTKQTGEGTGMGLAVIHGIVKSHGGDISVQSQPGMGTTFHVLLPCIVDKKKREIDKTKLKEEIPGGSERILLVDDEIRLVDAISQILRKKGYQVEGITDPVEALNTLQEKSGQFDLIISDITMPHMTGIQLAREIKGFNPHIPIILCSGFGSIISREQIKDLGIDDFITKPINKSNLTRLIRKVLDNRTPEDRRQKTEDGKW